MEVFLSLADGKVFFGKSLTKKTEAVGLLSFNTSAFGFEEIITNPANSGKIIMFTFPLVGCAGINYEDNQSNIITVDAVICKENSNIYSNFRAKTSIKEYLDDSNKLYAESFDTRAIITYLRENGEMPAVICNKPLSANEVLEKYNNKKINYRSINYPLNTNKKIKAKIIDLGASKSFYEFLDEVGIYNDDKDFDLIILSNTNYEDIENEEYVKFIKQHIDKKFIAFGDSNVLLAKAFGYDYKSLSIGHHGVNIPIKNTNTGKDHITCQNHLYEIPNQENIKVLYKDIHQNTTDAYLANNNTILGLNFKPSEDTFLNLLNAMGVK